MIKAIVFDFDGTILDTETPWYTAFREMYGKHNVELTLELYSTCIGTSHHEFDPYEYLITEHRVPLDRAEFRQAIRQHHTALMEQETIREGVMTYLEEAKAAGLKIGLASSSERAWIDKFLNKLGIAAYFDCIRTADNVKKVKPDPELYLQALECLGVEPDEAVAIEDSPNGAKAALAAGMHCVVTPNSITQYLEFQPCSYKLNRLSDLKLGDLIANPRGA